MKKSAIENQFNEKINAREIVPSKASWDRLDAMLAVAEKPKRSYRWMYVAAGFLGFILLGTLYFNQKNKIAIANDVVTVTKSNEILKKEIEPEKTNLTKNIKASKVVKIQLASTAIKLQTDSKTVFSNKENQVVKKEIIKEQQISIINQKTEQPVVLQKSKYVNVDELLASVDNVPPKKSSTLSKSNIKVKSNELLSQVDGELDLTFREKAIKTVNQNFKTVKVALSNRNSE